MAEGRVFTALPPPGDPRGRPLAGHVGQPRFELRLWPHVYRKAEFILEMLWAAQAIHLKENFCLGVGP